MYSRSNWNLLDLEEREKLEYPENNFSGMGENQQQTQPTQDIDARRLCKCYANIIVLSNFFA